MAAEVFYTKAAVFAEDALLAEFADICDEQKTYPMIYQTILSFSTLQKNGVNMTLMI